MLGQEPAPPALSAPPLGSTLSSTRTAAPPGGGGEGSEEGGWLQEVEGRAGLGELRDGVRSVQGFRCLHLPRGRLLELGLFTCTFPRAAPAVTLATPALWSKAELSFSPQFLELGACGCAGLETGLDLKSGPLSVFRPLPPRPTVKRTMHLVSAGRGIYLWKRVGGGGSVSSLLYTRHSAGPFDTGYS